MKKLLGKIKPIAKWVKNSALVLIAACFMGVMVWLALDKEYDKVVALAGVLVAIVSAPIFSIRAEMEKHLFVLQTEKKCEVYRQAAALLQTWLGNLYTLEFITDEKAQTQYRVGFENGLKDFCGLYAQQSLFFSKEVNKKMHDICLLASLIDFSQRKELSATTRKIEELHEKTKALMRQEIGL